MTEVYGGQALVLLLCLAGNYWGQPLRKEVFPGVLKTFLYSLLIFWGITIFFSLFFEFHFFSYYFIFISLLQAGIKVLREIFKRRIRDKKRGFSPLIFLNFFIFFIPLIFHPGTNLFIQDEINFFLLFLAGITFITWGGEEVVGTVLKFFREQTGVFWENDLPAGWLIGILERFLALILFMTGNLGSLGLILAFKSLARFEKLKEKTFAEYYLIGTLSSILLAVLAALFLAYYSGTGLFPLK